MKPILVALDPTDHATVVLAEAKTLAQGLQRKLILLRVVPDLSDIPISELATPLSKLVKEVTEQTRKNLTQVAEPLPATVLQDVRVEVGTPWRVICRAAQDLDVSMIVMGAHGHSAIRQALGTTAARVVNHADRTVVVVPLPAVEG